MNGSHSPNHQDQDTTTAYTAFDDDATTSPSAPVSTATTANDTHSAGHALLSNGIGSASEKTVSRFAPPPSVKWHIHMNGHTSAPADEEDTDAFQFQLLEDEGDDAEMKQGETKQRDEATQQPTELENIKQSFARIINGNPDNADNAYLAYTDDPLDTLKCSLQHAISKDAVTACRYPVEQEELPEELLLARGSQYHRLIFNMISQLSSSLSTAFPVDNQAYEAARANANRLLTQIHAESYFQDSLSNSPEELSKLQTIYIDCAELYYLIADTIKSKNVKPENENSFELPLRNIEIIMASVARLIDRYMLHLLYIAPQPIIQKVVKLIESYETLAIISSSNIKIRNNKLLTAVMHNTMTDIERCITNHNTQDAANDILFCLMCLETKAESGNSNNILFFMHLLSVSLTQKLQACEDLKTLIRLKNTLLELLTQNCLLSHTTITEASTSAHEEADSKAAHSTDDEASHGREVEEKTKHSTATTKVETQTSTKEIIASRANFLFDKVYLPHYESVFSCISSEIIKTMKADSTIAKNPASLLEPLLDFTAIQTCLDNLIVGVTADNLTRFTQVLALLKAELHFIAINLVDSELLRTLHNTTLATMFEAHWKIVTRASTTSTTAPSQHPAHDVLLKFYHDCFLIVEEASLRLQLPSPSSVTSAPVRGVPSRNVSTPVSHQHYQHMPNGDAPAAASSSSSQPANATASHPKKGFSLLDHLRRAKDKLLARKQNKSASAGSSPLTERFMKNKDVAEAEEKQGTEARGVYLPPAPSPIMQYRAALAAEQTKRRAETEAKAEASTPAPQPQPSAQTAVVVAASSATPPPAEQASSSPTAGDNANSGDDASSAVYHSNLTSPKF